MTKFLGAAVAASVFLSMSAFVAAPAAAQQGGVMQQNCRDVTTAAIRAAANASGLSSSVTAAAIANPGCARQLVRAVNAILSQAPADQRRALADQAAAGFVAAQQALIESGNVSAATSLAGMVAASGAAVLQTAFATASANNPVTAGGAASGARPPAQAGGNSPNGSAVVLVPGSLGGSGGGGGAVSPVRP